MNTVGTSASLQPFSVSYLPVIMFPFQCFLFMFYPTYEDGDLSFGLRVGLARFFRCPTSESARIALKVLEIESIDYLRSILMSRFFSEPI